METKNHLDLAYRLAEEDWFKGGKLGRLLFALGSIYPDINVLTYFRGHTFKGAQRIIARNIRYLQRRPRFTVFDYWRLGVLLHYVADIFTASHCEAYSGGWREHWQYEKYLRGCFRAHLRALPKLRLPHLPHLPRLRRPRLKHRDPVAYLRDKYQEYLAQARHPQRDCAYIAAVCRELARAVSLRQRTRFLPGCQ